MAGRLPYITRRYYPHMVKDEGDIWERYVNSHPGKYDSVDYDFRVGKGVQVIGEDEENYIRMAKMLSQKLIDVIGWNGDHPTIIEVKSRVGLSTLGQSLGYKNLFMKEFSTFGEPALLVVCEMISEDDRGVLEDNNIEIAVV